MKNEGVFQDSMLAFINSDIITSLNSGVRGVLSFSFLLFLPFFFLSFPPFLPCFLSLFSNNNFPFQPPAVFQTIQSWDPTEP